MLKFIIKLELPVLVAAGIVGQKAAEKLWERIFDDPVPDTAQKNVHIAKLLPVAVLEGTLYKLARMGLDRGLRAAEERHSGNWVGNAGDGE